MERRQRIGGSCTASPQQPWLQPQWTRKDTNAALFCLSNRSIWVLGNSVTRHWAFILAAILLDGVTHPRQMSSTSREMEKERCGRGGAWGGKKANTSKMPQICHGACACDFDVRSRLGPHAALLFKWHFHLDGFHDFANLMTSGVPEASVAPPDIVIYNAFRNHQSAPTLASQVSRALKARPTLHFYWLATSALCDDNQAVRAKHNEQVCQLNEAIEKRLCARGTRAGRGVRLLDGFGWTVNRCDRYDDRIHHSRLAFDHVTALLRQECQI